MSSLQSVAPIMATALYTSLYNATADLSYPWQGSYLFTSVGFVVIGILRSEYSLHILIYIFKGCLITFYVYVSLGFKQIPSEDDEEQERNFKRQSSNLHPDDIQNKNKEIICIGFKNHGFHF